MFEHVTLYIQRKSCFLGDRHQEWRVFKQMFASMTLFDVVFMELWITTDTAFDKKTQKPSYPFSFISYWKWILDML